MSLSLVCVAGPGDPSLGRQGVVRSERLVPDDAGALHLARSRPVVHDGVMLGAAVVPDRHAVRAPTETDLVFGNRRLADQVIEQMTRTRGLVLAVATFSGVWKLTKWVLKPQT